MKIEPFSEQNLPQLQQLINSHLATAVPGWALPAGYIQARLLVNPGQYVLDPWVARRQTLCALENNRVTAGAHLLHYRRDTDVGADYRGAADIAWFIGWPDADEASLALMEVCLETLEAWDSNRVVAWDSGLPVPVLTGLPANWPHVRAVLRAAGFAPRSSASEAVYGGSIPELDHLGHIGQPDLDFRRKLGVTDTTFQAVLKDEEIGHCECQTDLSIGGELPALRGWGAVFELEVKEAHRNRGVGAALVRHALHWLQLAGCNRVVIPVAHEDEEAGAGRFYRRFGWQPLSRQTKGWERIRR